MNTIVIKLLRDAWKIATGVSSTARLRAEKTEFRTNIIEGALRRNFALQNLSHLHSPELVRSRYTDKRLRAHTPLMEERWNY